MGVVNGRHQPDHHQFHFQARLGPVKALASLDPQRRAHGLDGALGRAMPGIYVMVGILNVRRKEHRTMFQLSITPNITVTIGHHTRLYFAFVTTAPTELDSPATVTLPENNSTDPSALIR